MEPKDRLETLFNGGFQNWKTSCFVRLADFAVKFVLGPYNHYRVALYSLQMLTKKLFSCFIISIKACTRSSCERRL